MDTEQLLAERRAKDRAFTGEGSPLGQDRRAGFGGLDYYPPDTGLRFVTRLIPGDGATIQVATSDGREKTYTRVGHVDFAVGAVECRLTVYDTGHPGLFIPFRDATTGVETYGGGRYLDVTVAGDGEMIVDFNRAYNPYCVYGDGYSCPIPPAENSLPVPIRAGERDFRWKT
jgi:uncharacterized protein (DUF1684 family)